MAETTKLELSCDRAINYAFQQNAIPVIKEFRLANDSTVRKDVLITITAEPEFAEPLELRLQSLEPNSEFRTAPVDLKLGHDFLAGLNEKVSGWIKIKVTEAETVICSHTQQVDLLARNEWCGLSALPEILAAFVLPNDPAIMTILSRASELLREHTGRGELNGYQDKSRKRAWEQVASIYKAIGELGIRYIVASASFETTGQKVRTPSEILGQRFGNCLDLTLLFAACCEQAGLQPLVLVHDGHSYGGCWLEERTFPEPSTDDIQHVRKLAADELITVFECTLITNERPGTLEDSELLARPHLETRLPFRLALDLKRSRLARIRPLPVLGQKAEWATAPAAGLGAAEVPGIGNREFLDPLVVSAATSTRPADRIDHWKSRLLDLSLRNRSLNFRETRATIQVLSAAPEKVEDELAASRELSIRLKPKLMSEEDPRSSVLYNSQQRADALLEHLHDELVHGRLHTDLEEPEHNRRLTELYRAARNALEENGTNTLFAAVGILEWRETEHSDRVLRAPLLLVPVELRRKSVLEGFSLRRIDEETRLNVTLMEMLRQNFQKEIPGLDPLPEDDSGVNVAQVFRVFRDAVRDLAGWEVKPEIWLGLFSFTKFLLWKDLADRLDDLTRNRVVRHLVHEAGTQYPNGSEDIKPQHLDDRFHPRDIFCPRSADSSQLAAVMAAADGHDFVLEGPPGTGKSQTITNIIAHCLSQGRRVLFVAEKRAALDVVYRRLREDGLEPFCLELHSNKTGKADVLAQFDRTLKMLDDPEVRDWEQRTAELERLRNALNAYTRALHRRHPCGLTAYHCLDYLLPRQAERTVRLEACTPLMGIKAETLERAREVANLMQERARPLVPLANHPLTPIARKDWSPVWAERTLDSIDRVANKARYAKTSEKELLAWLQCPRQGSTKEDLKNLVTLAENLLKAEPVGPAFAIIPWNQLSHYLDRWIALVGERMELRRKVSEQQTKRSPDQVAATCEGWSADEAEKYFADAGQLQLLTCTADKFVKDLQASLQFPGFCGSRGELVSLVAVTESLLKPFPVAASFANTPWHEWVKDLEQWTALVAERATLRGRLGGYDETRLMSLDLDELGKTFARAQKSWFLMRSFRLAVVRRKLRTARADTTPPDPDTLRDVLRDSSRLREVNTLLAAASETAKCLLGAVWQNGEPSAVALAEVREWGSKLHERMVRFANGDEAKLTYVRQLLGNMFEAGLAAFEKGTEIGNRLSGYYESLTNFNSAYENLLVAAALDRSRLEPDTNHLAAVATVLEQFLQMAPRIRSINAELTKDAKQAEDCLGVIWNGGEVASDAIERAASWGKTLHASMLACAGTNLTWLGEMRQVLSGLFREGSAYFCRGTKLGDIFSNYCEAEAAFNATLDAFVELVELRRAEIDGAPDHLAAVSALLEQLPEAWPKIREWCLWQKIRQEGVNLGLTPIIAVLEADGGNVDIPALFERSFRRALLFETIEQESALREFFGREHNERIDRFRRVDEMLATLARDLIRARLASRIPRDQKHDEIPKAEIGLLRREIAKKSRHIPVRQLISKVPNLLPRLKPCVLMSPLSVAQYLEPSHQAFDVVIFDEASQIPVWDAVGAIARGTQLIVVGDPKQLPPTNFFGTNVEDADDLTPEEFTDLESILDELMTHGLRHKRLKWHYRSRHEGLIAFSNRQYYDNDLLTFPSPETDLGGVKFKYLPKATYDKGKSRTNRAEAEALVAELVNRLRQKDGPPRSFGVVTFSLAQQQLVENLLDEERRQHPEIELHFGDEPPVEGEPVFVKNLENVQGDERDVIFFSICYGPDENGRVSMNFGPLNRDGGERRLNVAITRAKHEVVVFSGLRADQVDLNRARAKGVRDLKYFLDYAERGPRALAAATSHSGNEDAESEFETMVARELRDAGYDVHHQVGCSGYRIDLGILHPNKPGCYVLGVECDGATYHRAATARDRDKLRQQILEGLGWGLYRIWSTDWWHDSKGEVNKLLAHLKHLLGGDSR